MGTPATEIMKQNSHSGFVQRKKHHDKHAREIRGKIESFGWRVIACGIESWAPEPFLQVLPHNIIEQQYIVDMVWQNAPSELAPILAHMLHVYSDGPLYCEFKTTRGLVSQHYTSLYRVALLAIPDFLAVRDDKHVFIDAKQSFGHNRGNLALNLRCAAGYQLYSDIGYPVLVVGKKDLAFWIDDLEFFHTDLHPKPGTDGTRMPYGLTNKDYVPMHPLEQVFAKQLSRSMARM